jgi:hypothetical protein
MISFPVSSAPRPTRLALKSWISLRLGERKASPLKVPATAVGAENTDTEKIVIWKLFGKWAKFQKDLLERFYILLTVFGYFGLRRLIAAQALEKGLSSPRASLFLFQLKELRKVCEAVGFKLQVVPCKLPGIDTDGVIGNRRKPVEKKAAVDKDQVVAVGVVANNRIGFQDHAFNPFAKTFVYRHNGVTLVLEIPKSWAMNGLIVEPFVPEA